MADKIDMSLDEIIKRDKISVGRGGRGRGSVGKFANRSSTGGRGGGRKTIRKIGAVSRQMKNIGGGTKRNVQSKFSTQKRNMSDKWMHDKFVGDVKSSTLMISNLDYGVSDQDIRELFSEFGPLKKAAVHYDSSGRSLGKAEVIFFKIQDSIRALKKYNGVALDGRPMNIQPVVSATTAAKATIASRIGLSEAFKKQLLNQQKKARGGVGAGTGRGRQTNRARRGGRGGKVGGTRGGTGSRGQPKKMPTAAELDADLDAYTNKI